MSVGRLDGLVEDDVVNEGREIGPVDGVIVGFDDGTIEDILDGRGEGPEVGFLDGNILGIFDSDMDGLEVSMELGLDDGWLDIDGPTDGS